MNTLIGVNLKNGHFSMPNMYLSLGKSFHFDWMFSATPFVTMTSKFDVFSKDNATGSIGIYDAGIETVTLTRILLSFRMKAVNDINGNTFMLLPSVIDSESASFAPHWYLPRVNNEMGFRAGLIGHYYELTYSQGYSKDSNPLAVAFKINGDYFRTQILYQYNNKNSLSPDNFQTYYREDGYDNNDDKTHHLVQLSAMGKIPFLDKQLWLNLLGEYTWRDNDAHYVRLELGLEWKMLNIAIRPLFYIPVDYDNNIYTKWWGEMYHGVKMKGGGDEEGYVFESDIPTTMELAARLRGKLLLITGDVDINVHPANTFRLAHALIEAGKRFDMLVIPGADHGIESPYYYQVVRSYFVEHLLGERLEGADFYGIVDSCLK